MYIVNITKTIKTIQSMKSKTLSLKTIINELDFPQKKNSYNSMKSLNKKDFKKLE